MMKPFYALVLIILTAINLHGQNLSQRHEQVLQALEKGDLAKVETILVELQTAAPRAFTNNSFDYLLGRVRQRLGKNELARQGFLRVVERGGLLGEYALWHLAEIARAAGDLKSERQYLTRILTAYPDSLLIDRARWRLAENCFEGEEYQRAISVYRDIAKGSGRSAREAQLKIGQIEFHTGKAFEARATLEKLLLMGSRDDTVFEAVRLLDEINGRTGTALGVTDHLRRARVYQFNRAFDEARRHFQWIVDRFLSSQDAPEALFEIGRGYYQQGNYDQTILWYERAHAQFPKTREGEQGYYQAGHAHARAERWLPAVERYEKFIAAYPKSEWLPGAHLNAIDALRSAGNDAEALRWCRRTMERFPGELAAATALFSQARIHLSQDQYQAALDDFTQLLGHNLDRAGPSAPNRPEVTFMRGYCLEHLQKWLEAIDAYLSLPEVRDGYYGYRATARLQAMLDEPQAKDAVHGRFEELRKQAQTLRAAGRWAKAAEAIGQALRLTKDQTVRTQLLAQLKQVYLRLPTYRQWSELRVHAVGRQVLFAGQAAPRQRSHRTLASELIFLRLYDEGAMELGAALGQSSRQRKPTSQQLFTLAVTAHRGGHPDEAIRIGETFFAPLIPNDYRLELLPKDLARILYPTPYSEILEKEVVARNLAPHFVLALMRQESKFQTSAKSPAAARGLMQFIPSTAQPVAAKLGMSDFKLDDLYDPKVSIRLAGAHLAELFQSFPDHPVAVAAAYNAGADNVRRWLNRATVNDLDRFVIEIGFRETKDYVYQVMANYWAYQHVGGVL
jgi:soluble lytic murein transglycosylase